MSAVTRAKHFRAAYSRWDERSESHLRAISLAYLLPEDEEAAIKERSQSGYYRARAMVASYGAAMCAATDEAWREMEAAGECINCALGAGNRICDDCYYEDLRRSEAFDQSRGDFRAGAF